MKKTIAQNILMYYSIAFLAFIIIGFILTKINAFAMNYFTIGVLLFMPGQLLLGYAASFKKK